MTHVRVLDLSNNLIGAAGAATLSKEVVPYLDSLTELNLSNNPRLGPLGVKALAAGIAKTSAYENLGKGAREVGWGGKHSRKDAA